jgi:CRISPR-associated protein Csm3
MYAKIKISGKIELLSGMHIGGSGAFSAIGAVDSPIVKDRLTGLPLLPGSSLKGKMRSLLARLVNDTFASKPDNDHPKLLRLFGSAGQGDKENSENKIQVSRVLFSDALMSNWKDLEKCGLSSMTEVKFENGISRATARATPRQIERAVRGAQFPLELIYEIAPRGEQNASPAEDEICEDMQLLAQGMKLIEADYLGGSGSRGYGRVKFSEITLTKVIGNADDTLLGKCQEYFKDI